MADGQNVTVDNLDIEISATLDKANESIDRLCKNLEKLSSSLSKVNLKGLNNANKSLSSTQTSATKTASAMQVLAKAMSFVNDAMNRADGALNKFARAILTYKKNTEKADKTTSKFASTMGMLYARFWMLKRVMEKVWGSTKSAMGYIETLNYFNRAFEQVASSSVKEWSDAGYESAEAYAKSFSDRAKQLTSKLSGFNIDDSGMFSMTNKKSLGLNPTDVMNYQALFGQMASSMGVTSEKALALSNVLTKLGGDLASVKNEDFTETWGRLASGLVGMSRTVDRYGVNIRNVNLQAKLAELGIDTMVSKLNQQDKALLRTIVMLDATKYAYGDLAKTINQPANQLRMLVNNIKMLGQMIGSLILPAVAKILPYLNAIVIVLQRLVMYIGKLLGIDVKLKEITSSTGGDDSFISDILDEADDASDSLDDASDSAKKLKNNLQAIDELNIISPEVEEDKFDVDMPSYSDLLNDAFWDAVDDYQNIWQDAFDKIADKANEIADKIVEAFKKFAEPIKIAWDNEGDFVIDSWKKGLTAVKDLLGDIGRDMSTVWHQDETVKIFEDLFHILGDIGLIIEAIARNLQEAWNYNQNGLHILENIRDIIGAIVSNIREAADYTVEWARNLDFKPLLSSLQTLTRDLADNMKDISGLFTDFYEIVVLGIIKHITEESLPKLIMVFDKFVKGVDWAKLRKNLDTFYQALSKLGGKTIDALIILLDRLLTAIKNIVNSKLFETLIDLFAKLVENLTAEQIADKIEGIAKGLALFKTLKFFSSIATPIITFFTGLFTAFRNYKQAKNISKIAEALAGFSTKGIALEAGAFGEVVAGAGAGAEAKLAFNEANKALAGGALASAGELTKEATWLQKVGTFAKGAIGAIGGFIKVLAGIGAVVGGAFIAGKSFFEMWNNGIDLANTGLYLLGVAIAGIGLAILGLNPMIAVVIGAIGAVVLAIKNWEQIKTFIDDLWDRIAKAVKPAWDNIKDALHNATKNIGKVVKDNFDGLVEFVGGIWENIKLGLASAWEGITRELERLLLGVVGIFNYLFGGIVEFVAGIWQGILDGIGEIWGTITETLSTIWNGIIETMGTIWNGVVEFFSNLWTNICNGISEGWQAITDTLSSWWNSIIETLGTVWNGVVEFFSNLWTNICNGIAEGWANISTALSTAWSTIWENIHATWDGLVEFFRGLWEGIVNTIDEWWTLISENLSLWWTTIQENATVIWGEIVEFFATVWDGFLTACTDAWDAISLYLDGVWNTIKGLVDTIWVGIKDFFATVWDGLYDTAVQVWGDISEFLSTTWNTIKTTANEVWTKIKEEAGQLWDEIKTVVHDKILEVRDKAVEAWEKVRTAVLEKINNMKKDFVDAWQHVKEEVVRKVDEIKRDLINKWIEIKRESSQKIAEIRTEVEQRWQDIVKTVTDKLIEIVNTTEKKWIEVKNHVKEKCDLIKQNFDNWIKNEFHPLVDVWLDKVPEDARNKFEDARKNIVDKYDEMKKNAQDFFLKFKDLLFDGAQNAINAFINKWGELPSRSNPALNNLKENVSEAFKNIRERAQKLWEDMKELGGKIADALGGGSSKKEKSKSSGVSGSFATGGFPASGQLFLARESGPELVGSMGRRTAVANNQQIVDGISAGVYKAMVNVNGNKREEALLEELISAVRENGKITIDGRELVNAYDNRKARNGFAF